MAREIPEDNEQEPTLKLEAIGTEAEVIEDIARRQKLGIAKYGQTVADNPLSHRGWLQHAYEEALDFAIYLKRAMEELDKISEKTGEGYGELLNERTTQK